MKTNAYYNNKQKIVTAEAWSENGFHDVRVVGIDGTYIIESDFHKIEEAIMDTSTESLFSSSWYRIELSPRFENDGSGLMVLDWYELISVEPIK